MNPGTSADDMSSYAPTARSIRITGLVDQKFAPRVAWSVVILISVIGSGRDSAIYVAAICDVISRTCSSTTGTSSASAKMRSLSCICATA